MLNLDITPLTSWSSWCNVCDFRTMSAYRVLKSGRWLSKQREDERVSWTFNCAMKTWYVSLNLKERFPGQNFILRILDIEIFKSKVRVYQNAYDSKLQQTKNISWKHLTGLQQVILWHMYDQSWEKKKHHWTAYRQSSLSWKVKKIGNIFKDNIQIIHFYG